MAAGRGAQDACSSWPLGLDNDCMGGGLRQACCVLHSMLLSILASARPTDQSCAPLLCPGHQRGSYEAASSSCAKPL